MTSNAMRPNPALELTPQSGPKLVAILIAGIDRLHSRSISAAQLSAKPLGGFLANRHL